MIFEVLSVTKNPSSLICHIFQVKLTGSVGGNVTHSALSQVATQTRQTDKNTQTMKICIHRISVASIQEHKDVTRSSEDCKEIITKTKK